MLRLGEVCDSPSLTAGSAGLASHAVRSPSVHHCECSPGEPLCQGEPHLWLLEAGLLFSLDDFPTPLQSLFQPAWVPEHSSVQTGLVLPAPDFSTSEQLPQVGQTAAAGTAASGQPRSPVGGADTLLTTDRPGSFKCYYWKPLWVLFVILLTLLRVI